MDSASGPGNQEALERDIVDRLEVLGLLAEPAMCAEMLDLFLTSSRDLLDQLELAVQGGQAQACMEVAHAFKGATRNLGANALAAISFSLECKSRNGDLTEAATLLAQINAEFVHVEASVAGLQQSLTE